MYACHVVDLFGGFCLFVGFVLFYLAIHFIIYAGSSDFWWNMVSATLAESWFFKTSIFFNLFVYFMCMLCVLAVTLHFELHRISIKKKIHIAFMSIRIDRHQEESYPRRDPSSDIPVPPYFLNQAGIVANFLLEAYFYWGNSRKQKMVKLFFFLSFRAICSGLHDW